MLLCVYGVPHLRLGVTPSQVWGGTPSQVGGYPISGLGRGYPIPGVGRGVPHLRSGFGRGVPHLRSGGYPGYPHHPDLGWGTPQTGDGVPPYPDLRWGTPCQGYLGYPPPSRPGMGYPPDWRWHTPPPRPEMGYPPPRPGMGYPPLKVEQTHTCKNITSRRTCTRAVIISFEGLGSTSHVCAKALAMYSFDGLFLDGPGTSQLLPVSDLRFFIMQWSKNRTEGLWSN